jgi:hypothetical protein
VGRTWLQIRVDLLGGRGIELEPTPGRMMLVGPAHTFEQFAEAIDAAFARWDLSHLHEFELADGRRIGFADDDFDPEPEFLDHAAVKVAQEVEPGDEFTYTFDLGDDWRHRCVADKQKADPEEEYGPPPARPVAIFGWGSIPDQYGRRSFEDDDRDDDEDA